MFLQPPVPLIFFIHKKEIVELYPIRRGHKVIFLEKVNIEKTLTCKCLPIFAYHVYQIFYNKGEF